MKIKEIMTSDIIALSLRDNCGDACQKMREFNIGDVLVAEGNELVGIVTDRDIALRCVADNLNPWDTKLSDVASLEPITADQEMPIAECSDIMSENQIRRLPIVSNGELVGIVSLGDLAVDAPEESDVEETLEEISQPTR